ncbi:MAG: efflux RND transporter permease subunit [Candidatus Hydrogenedentes bacterium]|nr:efflux RND transporter permease subunit [Candidatus Hydrogenedentota bacterium]
MLARLVALCLENRLMVFSGFFAAFIIAAGAVPKIPLDAFPDTTPVQVQVNTIAPALSGEEIEQQLTQPIELALGGLPGLTEVRSVSKFGLSQVTTVFDGQTSIYTARQFIAERLQGIELPEGAEPPELGPISSGLGEVFHYLVSSKDGSHSLEELRTIHDWVIKPVLRKVPGVAEVNAWGGFEKQYHVLPDPAKLIEYGLVLDDVFGALEGNNTNAGGGLLVRGGQAWLVQGKGRVSSLEDIGNIVIASRGGLPIHVRDVAGVKIGAEVRRGAVTAEGQGEAVLGLGFMLMGENSRAVTAGLREALDRIRPSLPADVEVTLAYERTDLVAEVLGTVQHNLSSGAALVVIVLFVLLGSVRAGLLVAITIPMAMLFAAWGMERFAIAASLLSLGAIDFGIIVDGAVVMVDANLRRLSEIREAVGRKLTRAERLQAVVESTVQAHRPVFFGMLIIGLVFLPVLLLEGTEGKMFRPMALTFIFALAGALVLAVFLVPALSYYLLPEVKGGEKGGRINRAVDAVYSRVLGGALRMRGLVLGGLAAILVFTLMQASRMGGEFLPELQEGALVINVVRLAGISLEESTAYNTRMEQLLKDAFPDEVRMVWSRIGTAEVATDPMGIELTDIYIMLHPRAQWKRAGTQAELTAAIEAELGDLPGQNLAMSQPIALRMNELASGIRSSLGLKIFGDDLDELVRLADEAQAILQQVPGVEDLSADQMTGQPTVEIKANMEAIGRHGVPVSTVMDMVSVMGTRKAGSVFEGQRVFPLAVQWPEHLRDDPDQLAALSVPLPSGAQLHLGDLATVTKKESVSTVNREWGKRLIRVQANVRDRDLASFVQEAQAAIAKKLKLPEGYYVEWSGQFEDLQRAHRKFLIVVPITLAGIFVLLCISLGRVSDALLVYTGIPFAAIGGVLALQARGIPFSVSAAIGFIALAGIAVLNGQVLVSAIRRKLEEGAEVGTAVVEAACQRLRPVLATSITDGLGFLPMALSTGVGAEVQRPLATVVIAGVCTSTLLTLVVLPLIFTMYYRFEKPAANPHAGEEGV